MEILNKKARFDYFIEDTFECGLVLSGTEIKSLRKGEANIKDSYGIVKDNEIFLLNMYISNYKEGNIFNHEERRTRKLLLHKKQIVKLKQKIETEGYTLIPLKLYFKNNRAKILIGVGKGKKDYDKRQAIKERDIKKEQQKNTSFVF